MYLVINSTKLSQSICFHRGGLFFLGGVGVGEGDLLVWLAIPYFGEGLPKNELKKIVNIMTEKKKTLQTVQIVIQNMLYFHSNTSE